MTTTNIKTPEVEQETLGGYVDHGLAIYSTVTTSGHIVFGIGNVVKNTGSWLINNEFELYREKVLIGSIIEFEWIVEKLDSLQNSARPDDIYEINGREYMYNGDDAQLNWSLGVSAGKRNFHRASFNLEQMRTAIEDARLQLANQDQ